MDRRVPFFLVAAILCGSMWFPAPPEFRWVALMAATTYAVLAGLFALDMLSRRRQRRSPKNG